jgi:hypothetical protein
VRRGGWESGETSLGVVVLKTDAKSHRPEKSRADSAGDDASVPRKLPVQKPRQLSGRLETLVTTNPVGISS